MVSAMIHKRIKKLLGNKVLDTMILYLNVCQSLAYGVLT